MRQPQQNYRLWFSPVSCVSVRIRGSPNILLLLCIFYILLMTNQNTKNICSFLFLLTFSGKDLDQKHQKNDSFRQSQSSVNSSQTRVNWEFSKIFWLIITQETPRFMCLFPCLLWQVKNRARITMVQPTEHFWHFFTRAIDCTKAAIDCTYWFCAKFWTFSVSNRLH